MTPRPDLGIDGEPEIRFQPAVDMASGQLLGFEALLSWNEPVRGVLTPEVVLSLAEAHGQMTALNAWVLFEACSRAVQWESNLQLAVNCSVSELRRRKAAIAVIFALEQSGLNPDRLTVEVTETAVCDNVVIGELYALSNLGIQLAVDVGAGWTANEHPQHFAINTVKIDRWLVQDLETVDSANRTVIDSLIRRSRARGICSVAMGIETPKQVAILRESGADVGQGYFFAPPLSAEDARSLTTTTHRPVFPILPSSVDGQPILDSSPSAQTQAPSVEARHDGELMYSSTSSAYVSGDTQSVPNGTVAHRRRNRLPATFRRGRHSSS